MSEQIDWYVLRPHEMKRKRKSETPSGPVNEYGLGPTLHAERLHIKEVAERQVPGCAPIVRTAERIIAAQEALILELHEEIRGAKDYIEHATPGDREWKGRTDQLFLWVHDAFKDVEWEARKTAPPAPGASEGEV